MEWMIKDSRRADHVLHPSTEGALEAMQMLAPALTPQKIMDVGCGSGLLSLSAHRLWPKASIWAADISAQAVEDCTENIKAYGAEAHITPLRAEGFAHPRIQNEAPFDLILANLLAEILIPLAPEAAKLTRERGALVASGILAWATEAVITTYQSHHFELSAEIHMQEWRTLVFARLPS